MSTSRIRVPAALRSLLPLVVGMVLTGAARALDTTIVLGRAERWQSMVVLDGVGRTSGRWGELDLTLTDAAYRPSPETELLLHGDSRASVDAAGRYDLRCLNPQLGPGVFGAGSVAFTTPQTAIELHPRRGALFRPGTMWQDFSVEFWLYPASLDDGNTLLSWSGQRLEGEAVLGQRFSVSVRTRRLVFDFEGMFVGAAPMDIELSGITKLIPRQWHHHLLRFDSATGLLEYLLDGVPEAVAYATDTGGDGGSVAVPLIGSGTPEPLVLGAGIEACVDELRISRRFVETPALTRLAGRTGVAVSRIFDLGLRGTTLRSVEAVYDTPGDSEVYFFYRMADRLKAPGELESDWVQFAPGAEGLGGTGRYLQLMVELFPDGRLQKSPSVSSLSLRTVPDLAPAPPAQLVATAGNGAVRLRWSAVNETDLAGYRLYYGSRPATYEQVVDVGNVRTYLLEGLENGKLYYFTVAAYDTADASRRSAFAPETSARPSRLISWRP